MFGKNVFCLLLYIGDYIDLQDGTKRLTLFRSGGLSEVTRISASRCRFLAGFCHLVSLCESPFASSFVSFTFVLVKLSHFCREEQEKVRKMHFFLLLHFPDLYFGRVSRRFWVFRVLSGGFCLVFQGDIFRKELRFFAIFFDKKCGVFGVVLRA